MQEHVHVQAMYLTVGMEIAKWITDIKVLFAMCMNHPLVRICSRAVENGISNIRGKHAKMEIQDQVKSYVSKETIVISYNFIVVILFILILLHVPKHINT